MQMRRVTSIDDLVTGGRRAFRRGRRLARKIVRQSRRMRAGRNTEESGPASKPARPTPSPESAESPQQQTPKPQKQEAQTAPAIEMATRLTGIGWADDLELTGWAYLPGIDTSHDTSELEVWLEPMTDDDPAVHVALAVDRDSNPGVDIAAADPRHDHADGWFTATLTGQQLGALGDGRRRVRIGLRQQDDRSVDGFGSRDNAGSAGLVNGGRTVLRPAAAAGGPEAEAALLELSWDGDDGLLLEVRRPAVTAEVHPTEAGWQLTLEPSTGSLYPARIMLRADDASAGQDEADETEIGTADTSDCLIPTGAVHGLANGYCGLLTLVAADGVRHPIGWRGLAAGRRVPLPADSDLTLTPDPDGRWRIRRQLRWARLTGATIDPQTHRLHVAGQMYPATGWERLELVGPRETWSGPVQAAPDAADQVQPGKGFTAEIELVGSDFWEHQGVVPLAGVYQVSMIGTAAGPGEDTEAVGVEVGPEQLVDLPREGSVELLHWRFDRDGAGTLQMKISQPLADDERSKRRQAVLQGWSRNIREPLEDAVYFESFVGKFTSCSPGAIFAALRERRPDLRYYWGIRDHAVPVPDGGIPVLMHSREWWRIRATSRYLVTNSWVQRTFAKRPGQQVVQTWHGTPYKKLALDRDRRSQKFVKSTKAESATWDYLLAQSDYMAEAMVSAYGFPGEPLRTGYPRNDVIHSPAADPIRARLRRLLGISDDQQALLYAPTWREDRTTMVDELDLGELARRLGPDYVILARGHGNVLRRDHDHSAAGVIDVTSYPDATHLYLTADLAMTDYSSVMFDYTVTGKPLLFFVPDLDRYTSTLRGAYFDLGELAPGPLLRTLDEVVEQVRGLDGVRRNYAERYTAWQQKFDTWDDGGATGRVLDAVFTDLL